MVRNSSMGLCHRISEPAGSAFKNDDALAEIIAVLSENSRRGRFNPRLLGVYIVATPGDANLPSCRKHGTVTNVTVTAVLGLVTSHCSGSVHFQCGLAGDIPVISRLANGAAEITGSEMIEIAGKLAH